MSHVGILTLAHVCAFQKQPPTLEIWGETGSSLNKNE